ncbi:DUF1127 domain-containing protein [Qingshengfaniella alkalisoli]|uniref:DUF1127 domain-containing protein n=1 Tax=Qingshengfaniella alkalisoli TaxID=2599296 RepID=A0A5B8J4S5_9RHOB|nr:DUF1127 domain-containing protein [Qingshengfaniella alkalisoli]QDY69537.1 DUF1127 domain-containing protein [Qingshengfaniella alkalisoli]
MATLDTTPVINAAPEFNRNPFARLIDAVIAWNQTRVTRDALSRLNDRELADIGLSRSDIEYVARHGRQG